MKRLFQLSLLLNVVLLSVAGWRLSKRAPATTPVEQREPAKPALKRTLRAAPNTPAAKMPWNRIESGDSAQFIANLRAIGCPEQTIRDIVVMRVCRQYHERLLAAEAEQVRAWDYTRQRSQESFDSRFRNERDLRDDMMNTVETLLGVSWNSITGSLLGWPDADDPLESFTQEKRRQVREAESRYQIAQRELDQDNLWTRSQDAGLPARARELESKRRQELAGILSPSELEEYLHRHSAAADYVRDKGPAAKSEEEFRAMVRLAEEMGMTQSRLSFFLQPGPGEDEGAMAREYKNLEAAYSQRLQEMLGEQRLADLKAEERTRADEEGKRQKEQAEQSLRGQVVGMAAAVGVSADSANLFVDRFKEMQPALNWKFQELEKSLTGTPEQKQQQMKAAMQAELERIAVETMGAQGPAVVQKMMESGH